MNAQITTTDRLSSCLLFTIIFHLILVLGIGFALPTSEDQSNKHSTLEITLVNHASVSKPKKADYIAQASQQGGGDTDQKVKKTNVISGFIPLANNSLTPFSVNKTQASSNNKKEKLLNSKDALFELFVIDNKQNNKVTNTNKIDQKTHLAMQAAKLEAEISQRKQTYAKRPKRKYVSASTMESKYAKYMHAWIKKVERVGNLNYPSQSSKHQVFGELLLSVAIKSNGAIETVKLIESSGHSLLDESAINIVKLAAPFDKLPNEITAETDILHITRTWQFLPGSTLSSK